MRILITTFFLFATGALHAEVDGHTLLKYQQEADNRSVCFTACRCELETLLSRHYQQHPEDLKLPAGPVLARLFEQHYPCQQP